MLKMMIMMMVILMMFMMMMLMIMMKVSELSKKFGGAKKKCMEKIKSKMIRTDDEKSMLVSKQARGDCFPAFVFMLTPLVVVVLAG